NFPLIRQNQHRPDLIMVPRPNHRFRQKRQFAPIERRTKKIIFPRRNTLPQLLLQNLRRFRIFHVQIPTQSFPKIDKLRHALLLRRSLCPTSVLPCIPWLKKTEPTLPCRPRLRGETSLIPRASPPLPPSP